MEEVKIRKKKFRRNCVAVILIIMDEVYTLGEGKGFQSDIVILVIMDWCTPKKAGYQDKDGK